MESSTILIRCSSLGKIMAKSSGLTEIEELKLIELTEKGSKSKELQKLIEKKEYKPEFDLSEGAKTYVKGIVKKEVLDYRTDIESKYLSKGTISEQTSIDLYNDVYFSNLQKNESRLFNKYIQGECDLLGSDTVVDIKTSWSKDTFPMLPDEGYNSDYEWQLRGYMMLYDKPKARLSYCLVNTPDQLLEYENNTSLHFIDEELPKNILVTSLNFDRCFEKEEQIKYKVKECRKYAEWYYNQILAKI